MVVTLLLGGLALREPQLAAALAVVVTIILASRTKVHDWIKNVLTDEEVRDGLLLAAAALVILPLLPKQAVDPWGVVDLRKLWTLAVLVMAINGLGYIAVRALGAKVGLALAGLFSGFVSSTATIGAMGSRTKAHPELHRSAVAGAAASSIATVVQLAIVVGLVSMPTLEALLPSLVLSGLAATAYAGLFTLRSVRETTQQDLPAGRPFSPKTALLFVLVVGARARDLHGAHELARQSAVCCSRPPLPDWAMRMPPPSPRRRSRPAARLTCRSQRWPCWSASARTRSARPSWRSRSATGASRSSCCRAWCSWCWLPGRGWFVRSLLA